MEGETSSAYCFPGIIQRLSPSVVPILLVGIGYLDPGKWVAAVEGGARFGFDLVVLVLVFNFAAILCQYLSSYIGVITGRDLVQICRDEYDEFTCLFLGVQAELSRIALDLTMILGITHGLNLVLGADLLTCLTLSTVDVVLLPLLALFLENSIARLLCIIMAGFIMLSYVFGVLICQPEIPFSMNGVLTKLSGESAYALMGLLGASIMPHSFYVQSYFVKQGLGLPNVSKGTLCYDHFFAIFCVLSGIFLVNYVLLSSAANVFHSTELILVTFQDVFSLMDQAFRSPLARFGFLLVLLFSNQIIASTWDLVGQLVLHDFFKMDVPSWLHRATIRSIAIFPALYTIWTSGAEGIYQLLLFTQVLVALLLPSSVIPLFRVASSRHIMGTHKISPIVEFLALITFIGMLGLKIIFVLELIFGESDWVGILRWNMGSNTSVAYIVLLIVVCTSSCLMLWLLATPLKSASSKIDAQAQSLDTQNLEPTIEPEVDNSNESIYDEHEPQQQQDPASLLPKPVASYSTGSILPADVHLPETILDQEPLSTNNDESLSDLTFSSSHGHQEELMATEESSHSPTIIKEVSIGEPHITSSLKSESIDTVETTVGLEKDSPTMKDDEEAENWEPEESSKGISVSSPLPSEGPGSFRSLSGKSDDGGNGAGSLSRLAGLGRAARRQLAAVLNEFWEQLYDFHGKITPEAKAKKLDVLLGVDPKAAFKVDTTFPFVGGQGSDCLVSGSSFDSSLMQGAQSTTETSYGVQRGPSSSLWSNPMQLLDAYVQNSSRNALDSPERRYFSLRLPPSSDSWDYQPATVHGYQIASYLNRAAKDKTMDYVNNPSEAPLSKSTSVGPTHIRNSLAFSLGQNSQNGLNSLHAPGFQNVLVSRNNSSQSERPYCDICPSGPIDSAASPVNSKKFHSLPDISGLSVPHRELYASERSLQWDNPIGYGSSVGRTTYEPSLYTNAGSRAGTSLAFDELSSMKAHRNALPLQLSSSSGSGSLWSRQPFEQFGVANRTRGLDSGVESHPSTITEESTSSVDLEVKLLQSFRYCIVRLLKLEGSDWLFRQNDGLDEDLVDRVAAREKFLCEAETRETNQAVHMRESPYHSSDKRFSSVLKNDDTGFSKLSVSSVPHCGDGCIWKADLVVSFGVWCIHRILDLSLMESRPELWGKYTYVLNRLQGIIDLAFSKPRSPRPPCFCVQIPVAYQQKAAPPATNGILPNAVKPGKGKCTNASTLLDIVRDVEIAISCRKGRQGTAAGDVAFPRGKENLASVLKRYKRRLSSKQGGTNEGGNSARKIPTSAGS